MGILKSQLPALRDYIRGYKVYSVLLTQDVGGAPVATILDNTIGTINYTYNSQGKFTVSSAGLFIVGKTAILPMNGIGEGDGTKSGISSAFQVDDSVIKLITNNTPVVTSSDDSLLQTFFEIRVYL